MNRRFKVLKSHINFSCKNQLPLAKYLLNQKYDNVSYQRWMAGMLVSNVILFCVSFI